MEAHDIRAFDGIGGVEEAQRLLALARIGCKAQEAAARRALAAIVGLQASYRRAGHSALALEPARKAAVLLVTGHRPDVDLCVAGVKVLASVLVQCGVAAEPHGSATV